jgi:GT2 family glycosyltransferase/NifU-like protein involved in Fe-S cluster formation
MAIVDACPVAHTFRPVAARYSGEGALQAMRRYLVDNELPWPEMRVSRQFPRLRERRDDYLLACPPPADAVVGDASLIDSDLPLLWAVAVSLHAEQLLVFGPLQAPLARTLLHAVGPWHGKVQWAHAGERAPGGEDLPCPTLPQSAEELFANWTEAVPGLVWADPAAPAEVVRRWLDTWVKGWLALGGVAIFPHIGGPGTGAQAAVRDWLREQPREWRWQELGSLPGTGLLWRVGAGPDLDGVVARAWSAPTREEQHAQSSAEASAAACLLPAGIPVHGSQTSASVIIAAHNEGDRLWKTVQSCRETLDCLDAEILVVDDASGDGSVAELRQCFPDVRVVAHTERRGGPAAKDLGARGARGAVLVFLDGHCKPEPGAIARLVTDVEETSGKAIITPRVPVLDGARWQFAEGQTGHGYRLDLETLDQEWTGLDAMTPRGRFYESPALIGCCMALTRELYDKLWGFDPLMRKWGTEDVDLGLKAWLMGSAVLHDPEAVIGHVFQERFDHYDVPETDALVNHLRLARKNFTEAVWHDWLERFRPRHPAALWQAVWARFQEDRAGLERERAYLMSHREHDEFWYAGRFNRCWPAAFFGSRSAADGLGADPRLLLLRHRQRPANRQPLPDAHLVGTAETPTGERLELYLKLRRDRSGLVTVLRATFDCGGCDSAVPYASWLTEYLHGRPLDQVRRLTAADLERPFKVPLSPSPPVNGNGKARAGPVVEAPPTPDGHAALVYTALRRALARF